ncbi:tol-pal system YbgF family protein [Thermodesulfobacteriota bacterium]
MVKTKLSRKELLKTNDEFIHFSSRAIIFISEHTRQFKIVGCCLLAVILIYIGIYFYLKNENNKAHNIYTVAYSSLSNNMKPDMNKEDLAISRENFTRLVEEYGISDVSRLALPELAYIDFLEKNYDSAITRYQDFLDKTPEEPYQSLAMIALSICYEEKGEYEKAVSSLQKILSGPDDFFKEQAMLSLARIYRLQNNFEKSNEVLGEFIEKFPASTSLSLAKANIKP